MIKTIINPIIIWSISKAAETPVKTFTTNNDMVIKNEPMLFAFCRCISQGPWRHQHPVIVAKYSPTNKWVAI